MSVYRKGRFFHYDFIHEGVRHHGSTSCLDLDEARQVEASLKVVVKGRRDLEIRQAPSSLRLVYVVQGSWTGYLKIGSALDVKCRLRHHQCGSAEPLALMFDMPGGEIAERMLHRALKSYRVHGEWFRPDPPVMELLESAREHGITYAVPTWLATRPTQPTDALE